ncbi:type I restriction enzyme endonuclease domain-containing protein [Nostoc sp. ATCC 53789]|uniref:type I restriction enzyme endonuclease domain-containing protein n=1 Tax=Nostoc sp. ATCC 53789 TaxID=76335 RepID=UPI001331174C
MAQASKSTRLYLFTSAWANTRDLVEIIRSNITIDWTVKESGKANLRRLVKQNW